MPSHTSGALTSGRASASPSRPASQAKARSASCTTVPSPTLRRQPSDDAELHRIRDALDHTAHASLARLTSGLSPAAVADAYMDWAANLAISPGKQVELAAKAARKWARLAQFASRCASGGGTCEPCIEPLPQDKRFAEAEWQQWPFNLIQQSFLLQQQWWDNATTGIDGVTKQHQAVVEFISRQILDMASPSNFLVTNPVVQRRILETGGQNLVAGLPQLPGRLGADCPLEASRRRGGLPGGTGRGRHARQGGLPQPSHRTDPVRTDHQKGPTGADPDRARLDHEVLHPGPLARELPRPLPHGPGLHGVHHLLEEPDRGRSGPRHGRLPDAWRDGGAGCRERGSFPIRRFMRSATALAARSSPSRRPRWHATGTSA